jgi:hypothetical protein
MSLKRYLSKHMSDMFVYCPVCMLRKCGLEAVCCDTNLEQVYSWHDQRTAQ